MRQTKQSSTSIRVLYCIISMLPQQVCNSCHLQMGALLQLIIPHKARKGGGLRFLCFGLETCVISTMAYKVIMTECLVEGVAIILFPCPYSNLQPTAVSPECGGLVYIPHHSKLSRGGGPQIWLPELKCPSLAGSFWSQMAQEGRRNRVS